MTNPPSYNPWSVVTQPSAPAPFVPPSLTINNNITNNPPRETNTTNNYQKWVKYLLIISLSILLITIASAIIYILSNGNFVFSSEINDTSVLVPTLTTSAPTTTPAPITKLTHTTTPPTTTHIPTTAPTPTTKHAHTTTPVFIVFVSLCGLFVLITIIYIIRR